MRVGSTFYCNVKNVSILLILHFCVMEMFPDFRLIVYKQALRPIRITWMTFSDKKLGLSSSNDLSYTSVYNCYITTQYNKTFHFYRKF